MAFLKSGDPVVVDTHVLADAAQQERDQEVQPEVDFVKQLIVRCPEVILSPRQKSQDESRGELIAALRKRGFRFPEQSTLMNQLNPKLSVMRQSAVGTLSAAAEKAIKRQGKHGGVEDDSHLYATAAALRTVVVTEDESLLARAANLEKETGVKTIDVLTVLDSWQSGS